MKEISVGGKVVPVKDFDMNKLRYAKDGKFLNPRICGDAIRPYFIYGKTYSCLSPNDIYSII